MNESNWWKTMFDQRYLDTYLADFTTERTRNEVDFVVETVKPKTTDAILDLACGHGRHAIELANRGFANITGLDYSETFIDKARQDAKLAGVNVHFDLGDMKELNYEGDFDVVLLLFTAFGYFDDKTNNEVLVLINRALKLGGRLLLDVISAEAVFKGFESEGVRNENNGELKRHRLVNMGDYVVDETEWFDTDRQVIHNHREWQQDGEKKQYDYWVHVYTKTQYESMLTKAGYKVTHIGTGDEYIGEHKNAPEKDRTVILASKIA